MKRNNGARAITRSDLRKVVLRSFLLQAAWNFRGLQNFGFLYALQPVLRKLFRKRSDRARAYRRYLSNLQTHPYFASFLLGLTVRVEEERSRFGEAAKQREEEEVTRDVAGVLSGIGDFLFWASLKPLAALVGVMVVVFAGDALWIKLLGPVAALTIYNVPHFYYRISGVFRGYRSGEHILNKIHGVYFHRLTEYYNTFGCILIGVLAAFFCQKSMGSWSGLLDLDNFFFLALVLVCYLALLRRVGPTRLIYIGLLVVLLIGWMGR
jgi:fructoselysine and glucoselysine-specific PTS system IID component